MWQWSFIKIIVRYHNIKLFCFPHFKPFLFGFIYHPQNQTSYAEYLLSTNDTEIFILNDFSIKFPFHLQWKKNYNKTKKMSQIFCEGLPETFCFTSYSFKNTWKFQKLPCFATKFCFDLLINTGLRSFDWHSARNLDLIGK